MPVSNWNTNPDLNTSVGGVFIGENCPPSNLNNGERQIMADAKTKFDDLDAQVAGIAGKPALALIAPLTPAADKVAFYTGATGADLMTVSAFARSFLDEIEPNGARATLGAMGAGQYASIGNGIATFIFFGFPLTIQWGIIDGNLGEGQLSNGFNQPFNACFNVQLTPIVPNASASNDFGCQLIGRPNATGFTAMVQKFGSNGSGLSGISWFAVGN